jgi:hypothetical protein
MCVHIDSTQLSRGVTPIAAIGYAGVGMGYSKEGPEQKIGKTDRKGAHSGPHGYYRPRIASLD